MQIKSLLLITIVINLFGCSSEEENIETGVIRFNGVYQSEKVDDYWSYISFYKEGEVISVSSIGTPKEISSWFNRENKNISIGTYELEVDEISFTTTSSNRVVEFEGYFNEDLLVVEIYSQINGSQRTGRYTFVEY